MSRGGSSSVGAAREAAGELLEREAELAALRDAVAAGGAGAGSLVLVEGVAGAGKSTLLTAAADEARSRETRVLEARGERLERPFAFGVVLQLFEQLICRLEPRRRAVAFGGAAVRARHLFNSGPLQKAAGLFGLVHGLYWLVANLAEGGPIVLMVDDLQWADEPSLLFMAYLAQRLSGLAVTLVAAVRTGEPDAPEELLSTLARSARTTLRPAALSANAVGRLAGERLGKPDESFALACRAATGGNPFLVAELINELSREGVKPSAAATARIRELAPSQVLESVRLRLARLSPEARDLAYALAVLGDARLGVAAELAGLDLTDGARAADALEAEGLVASGERLGLEHPLIRSTLEAAIPAAERAVMHGRAAKLLASAGSSPERVAAHLASAPPDGDPWVVGALRDAAAAAMAAGTPASAAAWLRRTLAEPPAASDHKAVLVELARAEVASGDGCAAKHFEEAATMADTPAERAQLLGDHGHALYAAGRVRDAARAFERALAAAPEDDASLRLRLEASWVTVARLDAELRPEAVRRMRPFLDRDDFGTTHAERALLANLANQIVFAAEPHERAVALARRALAGGELLREETAEGMNWIGAAGALGWSDELDEYDELAEAALKDSRVRGSLVGFAQASYMRAFSFYYRGRLADALADLDVALDTPSHGWEQFLPAAAAQRAWALVERASLDEAEAAVVSLIDDQRWSGSPMLAMLLEARGRVRLARGDPEAALMDARASGEIIKAALMPNPALVQWRSLGAVAAAQLGDREGACALAREEVELARRFGAPRVVGMALRAAGLVDARHGGRALLTEAVDVLERSPARLELARALTDLGTVLGREQRQADARRVLRRALGLAHSFGALSIERQARAELVALGGRPRRAATRGVDALTPREQRIAVMAADGLSNREIAQSLFLTRRTVETHLTHAYQKLGITSRAELPRALGPS